MTATLADWLKRLGVEHPKGVLDGLDRVAEVAARANVNPPAPRNFIVAGTNGKGTTCLFLERLLLAAGHTTGTTLSPHLTRFNERIRVNGSEADDATIVAAFEAVERARNATRLNYFEYAVLAALATFRAAPMDAAVLEVGLGGRLDATNVVDAEVAVIVSIGLDHQRYLGDTREAIGAEKAGVMRPGRPVVFGAPNPPASVRRRAAELDAPFFQYGRDFRQSTQDGAWRVELADGRVVSTPTPPRLPAANAATALQAFALLEPDFDDTVVEAACRLAFAPGRLETVHAHERRWLLDVGHNADAAAFLACHLPGAHRLRHRRHAGRQGLRSRRRGVGAPRRALHRHGQPHGARAVRGRAGGAHGSSGATPAGGLGCRHRRRHRKDGAQRCYPCVRLL